MIRVVDGLVDLAAVRAAVAGVAFRRRGASPQDCLEGWLAIDEGLWAALDKAAAVYAREIGGEADVSSASLCTAYFGGMACEDHVDQYFGRSVPDTGNRTVSVSVIVERGGEGGDLVVQDRERSRPEHVVNPPPGSAVLFPADWWHRVTPVVAGVRRSVVRWYAQSSGERFLSSAPAAVAYGRPRSGDTVTRNAAQSAL